MSVKPDVWRRDHRGGPLCVGGTDSGGDAGDQCGPSAVSHGVSCRRPAVSVSVRCAAMSGCGTSLCSRSWCATESEGERRLRHRVPARSPTGTSPGGRARLSCVCRRLNSPCAADDSGLPSTDGGILLRIVAGAAAIPANPAPTISVYTGGAMVGVVCGVVIGCPRRGGSASQSGRSRSARSSVPGVARSV